MAENMMPPMNVKEKILICLDLTEDGSEKSIGYGECVQKVDIVVRSALIQFIKLKHWFRRDTEFALIGMVNNKAKLLKSFEEDDTHLLTTSITNVTKISKAIDVELDEMLFPLIDDCLKDKYPKSVRQNDIPENICRIILIYKSSYRIPSINNFNFDFFKSPFVFFDLFYVHEIATHENHAEQIFKNLCKINQSGQSYLIELTNIQIINIFNKMALLLAHPLQRPLQQYLNNDIHITDSIENQEDESQN